MFEEVLKEPLYPHQIEALEFHLRAKYSINGFQMGLGKTPLAIAFLETIGGKALVVCPAYLVRHWRDEIEKFSKNKCSIEVMSYSKFKIKPEHKSVVFDEVHYLKNISAGRTQRAHEQISTLRPEYFLGLSGTPIKNRVPEWWSLIKLCEYGNKSVDMGVFSVSYFKFNNYFANVKEMKIYGRTIRKYFGVKNAEELKHMIRPMYHRKTAVGLPERVNKFTVLEDTDLNLKAFQEQLGADFESANNMSTVKKQNAALKAPYTIKIVQEYLDQDTPVVVFTDHVDSCEIIANHFKVIPLHGATPIDRRIDVVRAFETGMDQILVCTIGAMSTGFSIMRAHHMVFNDLCWVPSDLAQAEARIRRITKKNTCFYQYVFGGETDQRIYRTLKSKAKTIREATDV